MHRLGLAALAVVALLAAVFVAGGSAGTSATPKKGGTIVFGAEQEPPCLNGTLAGCNNTWTSWTVGTSLRGLYIEKPSFAIVPDMADGEAKVGRTGGKFSLTLKIKKKAVWSDKSPVTFRDFMYTWKAEVNPKNDVAGRSGWDSIQSVKSLSKDGKTFRIVFSKPYAPWKVLLAQSIYPAALGNTDFNTVWNDNYKSPKTGQNLGTGPFILSNYTKGQSITMVRNPNWWGPHKPYLDKVVFVFRTNTDTEIQAIRGGEVDVIYPQPNLQLVDLKGQSGLKIESNAGTTLEHFDYNQQLKGGFPGLRAPWVRQAVSYAVNRQALISQIYRKFNPKQQVLQNLTYGNSQKGLYVPHFGAYAYSVAKVAALMKKHSCTKGGDGVYSCPGIGKMSIKIGTTSGNRLRELVVEIAQAQAKAAGIELVPANAPSRILFPQLSDGNYQIAMFAWVGSGDPAGQVDIYGCGGESNWKGYCSKKVTDLLRRSDQELNPAKRVALVNGADKIMALNVPTLPIVQKPTFLVFKTKLHGIRDNSSLQGPTDNMEDWWVG
jgi:ABC-type transport system substrate-binding protein